MSCCVVYDHSLSEQDKHFITALPFLMAKMNNTIAPGSLSENQIALQQSLSFLMTDFTLLRYALREFANLDDASFELSLPYWQKKNMKKANFITLIRTCANI